MDDEKLDALLDGQQALQDEVVGAAEAAATYAVLQRLQAGRLLVNTCNASTSQPLNPSLQHLDLLRLCDSVLSEMLRGGGRRRVEVPLPTGLDAAACEKELGPFLEGLTGLRMQVEVAAGGRAVTVTYSSG
ncbi:hypothetical protein CHLRE_11g478212v5 [Chlamydomonas reinhardtii]|uniref:Uncharacterized protein n=1 Tax=Chlamydomonas reinhardtii TaxID=3055 RepID=A0A2K3D8I8_CHLRE|nr:uncharacterized protein CHLRE_11g478212v5 [Chlamydomonas reinhardtii]PNW76836.1 hypothetical protein CHLRE_11g478212v5 [Chlamydomonas reinhardtii]